jgi:hypothetical protein
VRKFSQSVNSIAPRVTLRVVRYSPLGRVGASACESSSWVADSSLACLAPVGAGGQLTATVTIGGQHGTVSQVQHVQRLPTVTANVSLHPRD